MRIRREMLQHLAQAITRDLVEKGCIKSEGPREEIEERIRGVIAEELQVEDRLNDEVKELLRAHGAELSRSEVDYYKMFAMVKRKLAQERGIVL